MGGVLTSYLWKIRGLLLKNHFRKLTTFTIWKIYDSNAYKAVLVHNPKARERNQKVVRNATNSMVTEDMLDVF